jgi:hypothetical protein
MTSRTVDARWVRLLWALAAFVPLVVFFTPALAFRIGYVWLLCATYLWPAAFLAGGIDPAETGPPYIAVATIYCSAIALVFYVITSLLFRRRDDIPVRSAVILTSIVWLPIAGFVVYRALDYKDLLARAVTCPGHIHWLAPHCGDVTDFREYMLEGFIDRSFVARFEMQPGAVSAVAARNGLAAVDPARIPASVWQQPPIWWKPERNAQTRAYATAGFPYEERGSDGDHYLFIANSSTNDVYVFFKLNF